MEFQAFTKVTKRGGKTIPAVCAVNPRGYILVLEPAVKIINQEFSFDIENYMVEVGTEPMNHNYIFIKVIPVDKRTPDSYKIGRMTGKDKKRGIYIHCRAFLRHLKILVRVQDIPMQVIKDETGNYIILDLNVGITPNGQKYGS